MGTVIIKNLTTYDNALAVYLVFKEIAGMKSPEAEERGIYIKHRKGSDTYNVCEKDIQITTKKGLLPGTSQDNSRKK